MDFIEKYPVSLQVRVELLINSGVLRLLIVERRGWLCWSRNLSIFVPLMIKKTWDSYYVKKLSENYKYVNHSCFHLFTVSDGSRIYWLTKLTFFSLNLSLGSHSICCYMKRTVVSLYGNLRDTLKLIVSNLIHFKVYL